MFEKIVMVICVALVVLVVVASLQKNSDCRASGGLFVRTFGGFECLKR